MAVVDRADLWYREGNSDKVYHLELLERDGLYTVNYAYGRRGNALNTGSKVSNVGMSDARKAYNKILSEKTGKGYRPFNPQGNVGGMTSVPTNMMPSIAVIEPSQEEVLTPVAVLLNEIEESDAGIYISNDSWIAQPKMDGCLSESWIVEFEDGSKVKIKEVVENKIQGKVKSKNVLTGRIEFNNIKGWGKNAIDISEKTKTKWFKIKLENGEELPPLTGNHLLWLPKLKCWRRVDLLKKKDVLLYN